MKKKFKFSRLLALAALFIAGCAAYYSVFGLSQLFAGASLAVIIMASALEFSKIVAVSFLQRYWSRVSKALKGYLTAAVIILVLITSAGIYGFLSNAYQKTATKLEAFEGQISVLDGKKTLFLKTVGDNQKIIDSKNKRIDQLTNLRQTQESRLDGATTARAKSSARNDISNATKEIQKLTQDIDSLNAKNTILSDSANKYSTKALESKSGSSIVGEVGPLKYLAKLTGQPMDKVVNYFILLLIFVFDPLAVVLVIATNRVMQLEAEGETTPEPKSVEPKPIQPEDVEFEVVNEEPVKEEPIQEDEEDTDLSLSGMTYNDFPFEEDTKVVDEPTEESEPPASVETPVYDPVIPTGEIKVEDIKEKKELNRGFSVRVPPPSNKGRNNSIEGIK